MNKYKVYGLNIESDISINEFPILENSEYIDVKIMIGRVPKYIKEYIHMGKCYDYKKDVMWFEIKETAIYYILNGNRIIIEPYDGYIDQKLKKYISNRALGLILLQRNIVSLHGGAISINNKGCVFSGVKRSGKSTLTTALRLKGYKFLSDDVVPISVGDINMIKPAFGYSRLTTNAMNNFGYDLSDKRYIKEHKKLKYNVPVYDSFMSEDVPFDTLFELSVGDVDNVVIEEVKGSEKLNVLMKNIFKLKAMYISDSMNHEYFKKCIDISNNIKIYKLTRPRDVFSVEEQINSIENILNNNICLVG